MDGWDGYPDERSHLPQCIADQELHNVLVCTGYVQSCYAGDLRPDFKASTSAVMVVEFVGGSVSSFGIAEMIVEDLTEFGRRLVPHVNPHLAYLDLKHHVYTKVIVGPTQMELQYTAVRTVAQSLSSAFLLQRFVVPNEALRMMLKKERPDGSM